MGYSVVNVDEIEPAGPGGAVRFVRREARRRRLRPQLVRARPERRRPGARRERHRPGRGLRRRPGHRRLADRRRRDPRARRDRPARRRGERALPRGRSGGPDDGGGRGPTGQLRPARTASERWPRSRAAHRVDACPRLAPQVLALAGDLSRAAGLGGVVPGSECRPSRATWFRRDESGYERSVRVPLIRPIRRARSFMLGPAEDLSGRQLASVAIPLWLVALGELAAHL